MIKYRNTFSDKKRGVPVDIVIRVEHLTKKFLSRVKKQGMWGSVRSLFMPEYQEVIAVDDISFQINEGELVGFIGPNGAGKSTTLKMLTGILFPSSGTISVLKHTPQKERMTLAYKIGTVFGQRQQLLYHLPPIDSFNLFAKIYELKQQDYEQRLEELKQLFEIEPYLHTPVRKLSLGERMRCEFVAALLHKPQVLFLDEPTIGMDIIAKKNLRAFIKKINKHEKTTIILTSHDLEDIEELCSRVMIINKGRVLYDGTMDNIRKKLKHKVLEIYFDEETTKLPKIKHVSIEHQEPYKATLHVDRTKIPIKKVLNTYLEKCKVADIVLQDPPIEEVIQHFYKP